VHPNGCSPCRVVKAGKTSCHTFSAEILERLLPRHNCCILSGQPQQRRQADMQTCAREHTHARARARGKHTQQLAAAHSSSSSTLAGTRAKTASATRAFSPPDREPAARSRARGGGEGVHPCARGWCKCGTPCGGGVQNKSSKATQPPQPWAGCPIRPLMLRDTGLNAEAWVGGSARAALPDCASRYPAKHKGGGSCGPPLRLILPQLASPACCAILQSFDF
jgi:hypothetical protein